MNLQIPNRLPPSAESFPTSPPDVSRWLAGLPNDTSANAMRALYRGLKHSNRLENSNINRVEILRLLEPRVDAALDTLAEQYFAQPLPLPRKAANAHQLAGDLLLELGYAWKLVVNDTFASLTGGQATLRTRAIFHSMRVSAKQILHAALIYAPIPPNLIHDVNALYAIAEQSDAQEQPLVTEQHQDSRWSIAQAYLQIQLLARCSLSELRIFQIPHVCQYLAELAASTRLQLPRQVKTPGQHCYAIHLQQDSRPLPHTLLATAQRGNGQVRWFDLQQSLHNLEQDCQSTRLAATAQQDQTQLSRDSLFAVRESLLRQRQRSQQRQISHSAVAVATGLKNIHSTIAPQHPDQALEMAADGTNWVCLNYSDGGFCLLWQGGLPVQIEPGDLLAVADLQTTPGDPEDATPALRGFHVGRVRWQRQPASGKLCIGVETMGEQPRAVGVSIRHTLDAPTDAGSDDAGSRLECLLLRLQPMDADTLLLPAYTGRSGQQITLYEPSQTGSGTTTRSATLDRRLKTSGNFDQFLLLPTA